MDDIEAITTTEIVSTCGWIGTIWIVDSYVQFNSSLENYFRFIIWTCGLAAITSTVGEMVMMMMIFENKIDLRMVYWYQNRIHLWMERNNMDSRFVCTIQF
jgi:hypothetical protein